MPELKLRPKTLAELAANAFFYVAPRPLQPDPKAAALLTAEARARLAELSARLAEADWRAAPLEELVRRFAEEKGVKLGALAQPLRAALTGATASPGLFEVMVVLGREECLGRIAEIAPRDAAAAK
jgi:glutamyl-tRNA synthetase